MNDQPRLTTSINILFTADGRVLASASMLLPYLVPLSAGDTISLGNEFANVDSLCFAPAQHRLSLYCTWVYDPSELENMEAALLDAAQEGWTVERR